MTTHMLNFSVCSNNETVGNCGEFTEIANDAWIAEACNRLGDLSFAGEVDTDSTFRNWHGGRFSNQASLYGYQNFGQFVVCTGWTCEVESEDGGTETKTGYWSDLPAETQSQFESQIDAVIVAADAGRKEVEATADAE